jgi:polyphosphate kinase
VSDPSRALLLDRELSMLAFNERVLAMAMRDDVPLAERLRYVCIVSSNLDEFFEVRLSDLTEDMRTDGKGPAAHAYRTVLGRAHRLVARQYGLFNEVIMPALAARGVVILNHAQRTAEQREWVRHTFQREVRPLLSPIGLDPSHPFPQVLNKSLNFILQLEC